jgi:hypothetical protein
MMRANLASGIRGVNEAKPAPDESAYDLRLVLAYEDLLTRTWALDSFEAVPPAGRAQIQLTEWRIHRLLESKEFPDSVGAAARADIIVVALHATDELPIPLYVWIDAWLPRRARRAGALVTWIGVAGFTDSHSSHAHQYLHAVARRAGLDFLSNERRQPTDSSHFPSSRGSPSLPPPQASSSGGSPEILVVPAGVRK